MKLKVTYNGFQRVPTRGTDPTQTCLVSACCVAGAFKSYPGPLHSTGVEKSGILNLTNKTPIKHV